MFFGAKTINNLPLLLEITHPANGSQNSANVIFKVPVLPLKPLLAESLEYILSRNSQ